MAGQPIVPRSLVNPIGQTERINKTVSAIVSALDVVHAKLLERFNQIETTKILVNSFYVNKFRYEYQIDIYELERLIAETINDLGLIPDAFVQSQVLGAYEIGTAQAVTNLANISDDYTRNITQVLLSNSYQTRAAIVGARVFEEMEGFEGDAGRNLARILREAIQDGLNPSDVVGKISDTFRISENRARTIAQTEITGALRRARWDEAQDANERLGIRTKLVWISALKPTTRLWHAQRHGLIYSVQDVREFYATAANSINCYCAQTEILVDENNQPISPRVQQRLKKQKDAYFSNEAAA